MSTTIRKVALAVASAMVSLGAQATLVTFDDLWGASENTPKPVTTISGTGLTFSGATAYRLDMLSSVDDGSIPASHSGGFVLNRAPRPAGGLPQDTGPIVITLDANLFFKSVQFEYAASAGSNIGFRASGSSVLSQQLTAGTPNMDWGNSQTWTFGIGDGINSIEFTPIPGAVLALDTMNFDIQRTGTPPPSVPEPASYGLVAAALLAAGAAGRRRRQA